MTLSSVFVLVAAVSFLFAAGFAVAEDRPGALIFAYFSLFLANVGFSLLP